MAEPFDAELVEALARKLALDAGQNPDGLYCTAMGNLPAWRGYQNDALSVLFFLQERGFAKAGGE